MSLQTARSNLESYPHLCVLAGKGPSRLSQAMHNAGYTALGLPFTYVAFDTVETEFILDACRKLSWRGISLTIPHKEKAISLVSRLDEEARSIGAINTVVNETGELVGYNTDTYGIEKALEVSNFVSVGKKALVIGAGGAARAALFTLKKLKIGTLFVTNRTDERGELLAGEHSAQYLRWSELPKVDLSAFDLVMNASAIGSKNAGENGTPPLAYTTLNGRHAVFDFVTRETPLLQEAQKHGAKTIAGIQMLLFQAVKQFELFTGTSAPITEMEYALMKAYRSQS